MKKILTDVAVFAALFLTTDAKAQSLKDLFGKAEEIVSNVTGKNTADMEGTWNFSGSAVEFESENLLNKAGGAVAAGVAEKKLDEQLGKIGIQPGKFSFTFNADSTFTAKLGTRSFNGTYSYVSSTQKVALKFSKLVNINAKATCTSSNLDLLFNADKLMKLLTYLGSKSGSSTLKSVSSLASKYDGMMMGFSMSKQ